MHLQHYLLCYDIRDKKRLEKIYRTVSKVMIQVQYSVYYAETMPHTIEQLIQKLAKIIDPRQDDIRVYAIEPFGNAIRWGSLAEPKLMMFDGSGRAL